MSFLGAKICDQVYTDPEYCLDVPLQSLTNSYLTFLKGLVGVVFSVVDLAIIFNISMILRERNLVSTRTHIGVLVVLSLAAATFALAAFIAWFASLQPQINRDISKQVSGIDFKIVDNSYPIGIVSVGLCFMLGSIVGIWTSFLLYKGIGGHWNFAAWFGASTVPAIPSAPLTEETLLLPDGDNQLPVDYQATTNLTQASY